jgi:hypothetical protein
VEKYEFIKDLIDRYPIETGALAFAIFTRTHSVSKNTSVFIGDW